MSDKKIIFRSIWVALITTLAAWAFAVYSIINWIKQPSILMVLSAAFFGACALFYTYRLVSPRYKFINPKSQEFQDYVAEESRKKSDDLGIFTYEGTHFSFEMDGQKKTYKWSDVKTVTAYKVDMSTYDTICQDIIMDDGFKFELSEDTAGWFQFQKRLAQNIPQISMDWLITIGQQPFATDNTLLYDKENRSLEEVMKK